MEHGLWLPLSSPPNFPCFYQSHIQKTVLLACRDLAFLLIHVVHTLSGTVLFCFVQAIRKPETEQYPTGPSQVQIPPSPTISPASRL